MRFKYEELYNTFYLKDISSRVTRKNKNNESNLPLTISAQYGLVDQVSFFNKSVASKDLSGYYLLKNGEFAYNKSYSNDYPWGAIKRLDLYDEGCLSTLYICFKINNLVNTDYLKYYFESPKWYKQVSEIAGEGARNHGLLNIAVDDFFNTEHKFACIEEQEKIANFLDIIEHRIEVQNKIIEDYILLKNSIIHQFFILDNPKVKLRTLLNEVNNKNKDKQIDTVLSVSNKLGFIKQSEQFEDREVASDDTSNYKIVNKGDYAYNPARINVGSIARLINYDKGIISPMYSCFSINKEKITYTYFDMFLSSSSFKKQLNKKLEGSVRQCLTFEGMLSMDIELPPIEIQKSISNKIDMLNKKIKMETDYCDVLIKQKQFLLNNMFI
ncbi:MAG: restriction endonuclease subunit S [Faecalibacillus sp.]